MLTATGRTRLGGDAGCGFECSGRSRYATAKSGVGSGRPKQRSADALHELGREAARSAAVLADSYGYRMLAGQANEAIAKALFAQGVVEPECAARLLGTEYSDPLRR